jgi:biopolymer transport protein ExbB
MSAWWDAVAGYSTTLWARALEIWVAGGWCMLPIALVGLVLFGLGVHIDLRLRRKGYRRVRESTWRRWLEVPRERHGSIGRLLDTVARPGSLNDMASAFAEVRAQQIAPFRRDLRVMRVCIAAAPLLGLLGTVTGMLATFGALASGAGGEQTMGMVAQGISEALITTETGLVVALPGVFFQYQLMRKFELYQAFLAHLETVCTQQRYRQLRVVEGAA